MAFPDHFLDDVRARLKLSDLVGRRVKLIRRGQEFSGLCPFHHEKSPSFTVSDPKGFYHCFGCQAHGDIFKFVMETEGVSFPEAVERLADQAGLAMPEQTREAAQQSQMRASLGDAMVLARDFFAQQLKAPGGAQARAYLESRGIDGAAIQVFKLGFAPGGGAALMTHLAAAGVDREQMLEAGLIVQGEEGPARDFFRNRLIIPINDPRGRPIAFGARALLADAKPKYLNSPDTPLFHKGRTLYNLDAARKPAYDARAVIVAEGYMDVIALVRAGIPHAVAPLGTALTEEQLGTLWRFAPEPTICLDGDAAGVRAAQKAALRALPLLKPGHSLKFVFLPQGRDPDDLIRAEGAEAMKEALTRTVPLAEVLWSMQMAGHDISTPERRAGLQAQFSTLVQTIADPVVRSHYQDNFRQRLDLLFGRAPRQPFDPRRGPSRFRPDRGRPGRTAGRSFGEPDFTIAPPGHDPALNQNSLAKRAISGGGPAEMRDQILLAALLKDPGLIERHYESVEGLVLASSPMMRLRQAMLDFASTAQTLDKPHLYDHLAQRGLADLAARIESRPAVLAIRFLRDDAAPADLEAGFLDTLTRHRKEAVLKDELRQVRSAWALDPSPELAARMRDLEARLSSAGGEPARPEPPPT